MKNTIGFYAGVTLMDTSKHLAEDFEQNRDYVESEAEDLAGENDCQIDVWGRDSKGQQVRHLGITIVPTSR